MHNLNQKLRSILNSFFFFILDFTDCIIPVLQTRSVSSGEKTIYVLHMRGKHGEVNMELWLRTNDKEFKIKEESDGGTEAEREGEREGGVPTG